VPTTLELAGVEKADDLAKDPHEMNDPLDLKTVF